MKKKWKVPLLGLMALMLLNTNEVYSANRLSQEMPLIEAIEQISKDYEVYFTFDKTLISNIKVHYDQKNNNDVEEAVSSILKGTSLTYKLFNQRYMIIYKNDEAGLQSLRKMSKYLDKLIKTEEETILADKEILLKIPSSHNDLMVDIGGKVVNDMGEPLVGVTILVKGTDKGTITDLDGNFVLADVGEQDVLIFSYIGYIDQEIQIGVKSEINVTLMEDSQTMDEVVITALGIQRETRSLGYSVGELSSEDLNKVPQENVLGALNGKVAGLKIANSTNDINSEVRVYIRGNTSLTGNDDPLVIIDGVPVGDPGIMQDLNPDDISSVSVLKGPSAAALYGSRAGNGVLIITTKTGASGQEGIGISVNSALTFNVPYEYIDLQNRFTTGKQGIFDEGAYQHWYGPEEGASAIQWNSDGEERPLVFYPDNLSKFFRTGVSNLNDVSINGAYDKGSFRLSLSNLSATGTTPGTELNRLGLNLAASYKLAENLSVSTNINISNTFSDNYPVQEHDDYQYQELYMVPPHVNMNDLKDYWVVEDELQSAVNTSFNNPWFLAHERVKKFNRNRGFGNVSLDWEIKDDLNFMARIAQVAGNEKFEQLDPWSLYGLIANPRGGYQQKMDNNKETNADVLISYSKSFGDFHMAPSVGGNLMWQNRSELIAGGNNIVLPGLFTLSNVERGGLLYQSGVYRKSIYSAYGMLSLGYKDMVYLDLTARNDWSSTLPVENRSYFYPSASFSLVFNEFIKMPEWVGLTKFRTGWAQVGKDTDPYEIQQILSQGTWGDLVYYTNPGSMVNTNLKPEIATSFEVGLDMAFLQNRIKLDATYYTVQNKNQILNVGIPGMTGFSSTTINAGIVENTGWEIGLFTTPVRKRDFQWDLNMNFTRQSSKLTELTEGVDQIVFWSNVGMQAITQVGEELGDIYARDVVKVEEGPYAGWALLDANGKIQRSNEYSKVGNYLHKFLSGMQTTVSYKSLSLSASFDWRHGGDFYSMTMLRLARSGKVEHWKNEKGASTFTGILSANDFDGNKDALANEIKSNQDLYQNQWIGGRTEDLGGFEYNGRHNGAFFPGVISDGEGGYIENFGSEGTRYINAFEIIEPGGGYWDVGHGHMFIYDASFVKLREIALSYQLPESITKLIKAQHASIAVYSKNIMLWTAAGIGIDPELAFLRTGSSLVNQGVDRWNGGPWTSPIGVKLNVDF